MLEPHTFPLAVAVPTVGVRSETFVWRHANGILPGRTAVIGETISNPAYWTPDGPCLALYRSTSDVERKVRHRLERSGIRPAAKLTRFLKDHGVRVVVAEYLHSLLPYIEDVQQAGVQWFSFGHGYDVSALLKDPVWRERLRVQRGADGVFVRAESIRQRMIEFGLDANRVHVVYGGVEVADVFPERRPRDDVSLVSVGRMVPKKAPLLTLEAFRTAQAQHPSLQLHFVGDGPLLESARKFVEMNGLGQNVILYGGKTLDFVSDLMKRSDLYVQHSIVDPATGDEEGMPSSILEAMGVGLPVVSTRHAGIPEAVREGIDGYLVAEGDVEGMANRILDLARSSDSRRSMGEAAWRRACGSFTWEHERSNILRVTQVERYL